MLVFDTLSQILAWQRPQNWINHSNSDPPYSLYHHKPPRYSASTMQRIL